MTRFLLVLVSLLVTAQLWAQTEGTIFPELEGEALAEAIRDGYRPASVLSYRDARDTLYALIDSEGDSVACFYTGYRRYLAPGEDPSKFLYADGDPQGINCEHAWPRSKGAGDGFAYSDMHHLFPTQVGVNQARGNRPYGEVQDHRADRWYRLSELRQDLPPEATINEYCELGDGRFEPREAIKGDVARALFYIHYIYPELVEANFFGTSLFTLRYWHMTDPPDTRERSRTWQIARYQDGKPNPFIVDPTLIDRILGPLD